MQLDCRRHFKTKEKEIHGFSNTRCVPYRIEKNIYEYEISNMVYSH